MSKRRISKASKRRLSFFGPIFIFFIVYCFISLAYNLYMIYSLSSERNSLEKEYIALQEQAKNLKIDIDKLNDPEYLANYARENYRYSKDGEIIIQLDSDIEETNKNIKNIDNEINKEYILLGLSILLIIIFIYILKKGKKKKK